jgi:hypothetical protein
LEETHRKVKEPAVLHLKDWQKRLLDAAEHLSGTQRDETLDFMEWLMARKNMTRGAKKK